MSERVTVPSLQQMKHEGRKIVGVVAWDYQMARIADRAGVEIVSVGDSARCRKAPAVRCGPPSGWSRRRART